MNFGGDAGVPPSAADADAAMERLRHEVNQEMMQGLVQDITDKCFEKCVPKPGVALSGGEQACLARCQDRYMNCMAVVYAALARQAQKSGEER
jgi:mitochondrial import inner membrane translocase subunit TIM13